MAYSEALAERVRNALDAFPSVVEKRMFGGLAFVVNGKMCVSVNQKTDHVMMVRIDPNDQEALKRKGAKVAMMRGRKMPGWIFLTKEAIETQKDFDFWVKLASDFNKELGM